MPKPKKKTITDYDNIKRNFRMLKCPGWKHKLLKGYKGTSLQLKRLIGHNYAVEIFVEDKKIVRLDVFDEKRGDLSNYVTSSEKLVSNNMYDETSNEKPYDTYGLKESPLDLMDNLGRCADYTGTVLGEKNCLYFIENFCNYLIDKNKHNEDYPEKQKDIDELKACVQHVKNIRLKRKLDHKESISKELSKTSNKEDSNEDYPEKQKDIAELETCVQHAKNIRLKRELDNKKNSSKKFKKFKKFKKLSKTSNKEDSNEDYPEKQKNVAELTTCEQEQHAENIFLKRTLEYEKSSFKELFKTSKEDNLDGKLNEGFDFLVENAHIIWCDGKLEKELTDEEISNLNNLAIRLISKFSGNENIDHNRIKNCRAVFRLIRDTALGEGVNLGVRGKYRKNSVLKFLSGIWDEVCQRLKKVGIFGKTKDRASFIKKILK